MSTNGGDSVFPKAPQPQSGVKLVLQYTGIPPSWLDKRPRLPGRNWLIFLSVTSTITGYYFYDRKQCKQIRQEYVDRVKHLSKVPLHSLDLPRKVTVYGSKWPADEEYDRSMKYFRKYVKPIIVAAAVDYEMIMGRRHGDLAERIANAVKQRRRLEAGIDPPPLNLMNLPNSSPEAKRRRELEGGIVLVGRPTFKEFMAGIKRGWTEPLEIVDKEEHLAKVLESDGHFDEPELDSPALQLGDDEPIPTQSKLAPSQPFSPFASPQYKKTAPVKPADAGSIPSTLNAPPSSLPPQPPILLVSFLNHIGLTYIPHMIWEFFNERHKVRAGAEDAYRLLVGETRPFAAPAAHEHGRTSASAFVGDTESWAEPTPAQPYQIDVHAATTDLDFDRDKEAYYKKSIVKSFLSDIEKARKEYYAALAKKLETARALSRGDREPTKDETSYPPPTEVELRAERMKKELRWRSDEKGWEIVRPESPVAWDERFRDVLNVFVAPSAEREAEFRARAQYILEQEKLKEQENEQHE